jgi:hypothetical protein
VILAPNGHLEHLAVVTPSGERRALAVAPDFEHVWGFAAPGDLDGDGRTDVVLGFAGLRNPKEEPATGSACVYSLARTEDYSTRASR